MNPFSAAVLALGAVGLTFAPWREAKTQTALRGLALEAAGVAAAVIVAELVSDLARPTASGRWWGQVLLLGAGYWYAMFGGIGVVRLVLALVPVAEKAGAGGEGITVPEGELVRGRIIGVLERALVLTLVLVGQYGALGLIVAAKAVARFRGLEDRDFAEYFLIGTLASLLHAVLVGVGIGLLR